MQFAAIIPFTQTLTGISDGIYTISEGVMICPNPSSGFFTIRGEGEAWIYDAGGRLVFHSLVNNTVVDLSSRPEGMYFMKLLEGKRWVAGKFILIR